MPRVRLRGGGRAGGGEGLVEPGRCSSSAVAGRAADRASPARAARRGALKESGLAESTGHSPTGSPPDGEVGTRSRSSPRRPRRAASSGCSADGDTLRIDLTEGRIRTGVRASELESGIRSSSPDQRQRLRRPLRPLGPARARRCRVWLRRLSRHAPELVSTFTRSSPAAGSRVDAWDVKERGLRHDRRWMLVDEAGLFMSQREVPAHGLDR